MGGHVGLCTARLGDPATRRQTYGALLVRAAQCTACGSSSQDVQIVYQRCMDEALGIMRLYWLNTAPGETRTFRRSFKQTYRKDG